MRKVILPQAVKITIPSLINQFIITLKDTTLVLLSDWLNSLHKQVKSSLHVTSKPSGLRFDWSDLHGCLLLLMWAGRRIEQK